MAKSVFDVYRMYALLVEHEADGAGRAEVAAVLGKAVAHVGSGTVAVVGDGINDDRNAAGRIAFIGDLLRYLQKMKVKGLQKRT